MPSVSSVASGVAAASTITTRKEFERWNKRSKCKKRFLFRCYLIGGLAWGLFSIFVFGGQSLQKSGGQWSFDLVIQSLGAGFGSALCCGGPLAFIACWMLLSSGIGSFKSTLNALKAEQRVCDICESVGLYDDKYVQMPTSKKYTKADLVPHMNVIEEDGKTHVLCDACLAKVSAIDAV